MYIYIYRMSCFHMPTIVDVYKNDNFYQMLTSPYDAFCKGPTMVFRHGGV